jgi:hypothetical protein
MRDEGDRHQQDHQRVDFTENAEQQRRAGLGQHQEMNGGFLWSTGALDVAHAMTKPICRANEDPER